MAARLRCAIYTRKSSEEGLEQSFNSLHAQREACEAYVLSQAGEGWSASKATYDDGGFSGGSMERPGLKALLADIDAGLVDVVVVYKVDRLTRSLMDFAKIVEAFDKRGVSFVSVTQAFNTTTSMGRLTLNVLLSFAQFEREVTGERIRDKIAASKAKGMWMGGAVPLGYDVVDRKLIVNEAEAATVRLIFELYLKRGSVRAVIAELDRMGIRTKRRETRAGKVLGDKRFGKGGVFHLLKGRVYLGEIVHKDAVYPGLHSPIVSRELFDAVTARMAENAVERDGRGVRAVKPLLIGKLFDPNGEPMTPTYSYGRKGRLYRYYATRGGNGCKAPPDEIRRVSIPAVEAFLHQEIERLVGRSVIPTDLAAIIQRVDLRREDTLLAIDIARAAPSVHQHLAVRDLEARLQGEEALFRTDDRVTVLLPRRLHLRGGRRRILEVANSAATPLASDGLRAVLKRGHQIANDHHLVPRHDSTEAISPKSQHLRELVTLTYLAPALQRRIISGAAPASVTIALLSKRRLPLAWADQHRLFETGDRAAE